MSSYSRNVLILISLIFARVNAWVSNNNHCIVRRQISGICAKNFFWRSKKCSEQDPNFARRSTTSSTRHFAFLWFGSDEKEETDEEMDADELSSSSLAAVANVMDTMATFKTSQRVGDRTAAVLQDLSNTLVEGSAADGKVKVTYNGQQRPIGVQIDETYFQSVKKRKEGANELSIALTQAMQDAHNKSAAKIEEKMKSVYSDFGLET